MTVFHMIWKLSISLLLVGLLASCDDAVVPPQPTPSDLQTGTWRLVSDPLPVGDSLALHTLDFSEDEFGGNFACNVGGGEYSANSDGDISIDVQITTEAYCGDQQQPWANHIIDQLETVTTYAIDGDELTLTDDSEKIRLEYERE